MSKRGEIINIGDEANIEELMERGLSELSRERSLLSKTEFSPELDDKRLMGGEELCAKVMGGASQRYDELMERIDALGKILKSRELEMKGLEGEELVELEEEVRIIIMKRERLEESLESIMKILERSYKLLMEGQKHRRRMGGRWYGARSDISKKISVSRNIGGVTKVESSIDMDGDY